MSLTLLHPTDVRTVITTLIAGGTDRDTAAECITWFDFVRTANADAFSYVFPGSQYPFTDFPVTQILQEAEAACKHDRHSASLAWSILQEVPAMVTVDDQVFLAPDLWQPLSTMTEVIVPLALEAQSIQRGILA